MAGSGEKERRPARDIRSDLGCEALKHPISRRLPSRAAFPPRSSNRRRAASNSPRCSRTHCPNARTRSGIERPSGVSQYSTCGGLVAKIVAAHRRREGGGFIVRRPFPSAALRHADPFLFLDEMGPADYRPGEAFGGARSASPSGEPYDESDIRCSLCHGLAIKAAWGLRPAPSQPEPGRQTPERPPR